MKTANAVLTRAFNEVGYVETPVNKTKYSRAFGVRVAQWCGYFVDWCFKKEKMNHEPTCAYTPLGAKGYNQVNRLSDTGVPQAGDVLFFDFPSDDVNRISHTGFFVKKIRKGVWLTIEGNTSGNNLGDQRNGGMVAIKERKASDVVCYGRPLYKDAPVPVVDEIVAEYYGKPKPVKKIANPARTTVRLPADSKHDVVVVKSGDTLWDLAIKHQATIKQIKKQNKLSSDTLRVGQKLVMPLPTKAGKVFARLFGR